MTAFYDHRAEQAINQTASEALGFVNQLYRESARPEFDWSEVCFWAAQSVAPDAGLARQLQMARLAKVQVMEVMQALHRTVAA